MVLDMKNVYNYKLKDTVSERKHMKKDNRKYYAAYEERYKTAHSKGVSWSSNVSTPIVMEVIDKYKINRQHRMLEIGCGEGRDSKTVLEHGFPLMATDISEEAIHSVFFTRATEIRHTLIMLSLLMLTDI